LVPRPGLPPLVRILDFGIAKFLQEHTTDPGGRRGDRTGTMALLGSLLIMSPEQCRGAGFVDHRTDIYALGIVIFFMVVGEYPFMSELHGEMLAMHMRDTPPRASSRNPLVPP